MVSTSKNKKAHDDARGFILDERELAKVLGKTIQELDEIVAFFDADQDDDWELIENIDFRYANARMKKRVYSAQGAHAIARYVDQHPEHDKRNLFKKIKDWVLDAKGKVRKSLVRQHIITNLDIHNKNIIRVKNGSPYIFRKSCVLLLKTSFAKWNSVLKDIQKTATPFIPGEHLEEDIDLQDTFFRSDALSRVGLQLSKELKNKQRRLWCEDFNLECQSVIKQLMSEEEARLKRIQTAKEKAKKRDKKRCQVTGVHRDKYNNVTVEAHHLYCASIFPHLADLEDNLITLDSTIHQDFHAFMGGTQVPCTVDDFLLFLHENHPDSTQRLGVYLERVKRIFNDPQIPEDS
jgi:hypothetical protein